MHCIASVINNMSSLHFGPVVHSAVYSLFKNLLQCSMGRFIITLHDVDIAGTNPPCLYTKFQI